jgi:hypothetical protein
VPVIIGDDNVPPHPALADTALSLPSLLLLPALRELRIRDTHLGDPRWSTVRARCELDTLEIGSCCFESPDFNRACAERIIDAAAHAVRDLSLSAALSSDPAARRTLPHLNKLRVTSLLPIDGLADTLAALSDSPVEELSLECHSDDVEDECLGLSDFLDACDGTARRPFVSRLRRVSLETVEDVLDPAPVKSTVFDCRVDQIVLQEQYQQQEQLQEAAASALDVLRGVLGGVLCTEPCEIEESPRAALGAPTLCRPVQPLMEQMTWSSMMEAW